MNSVFLGKIRKLAIKKVVFPALFGLVALAAQMIAPAAYLYAKGSGTVTLSADVQSSSIICVSININGNNPHHPHIHQHPATINFVDVANPGDIGSMRTFKDHTCQGTVLNTIAIKIPKTPATLSKCTIVLGTRIGKLTCK
ncbi:MAG TPA: hypothetical protein VGL94_22920 [Ktedonobacteraceae bacterium]